MSDPNGWPPAEARGYWDCDCGRECRNKPLTLGCRAEWKDAEARPFPAPLQMHEGPTTRRLYTPAEVAAREAAAEARGREAGLREAAGIARRVPIPGECSAAEAHGRMTGALAACEAILARIGEAPR